jgi:hypothetical protein
MDERPEQPEDDGITAYHGSPHDFDQFDLSKIGTGEGAQVYGHGLYFAENEDIARAYRDALTDRASSYRVGDVVDMPKWILRGIERSDDKAAAIAEYRAVFTERLAEAQREAVSSHQPWLAAPRISSAKDVLSGLDVIEKGAALPHTSGRMYEVRINAHPDHFLDWDAPLSKQPHIMQAIDQHIGDPEIVLDQLFGHREATGRDLHERFGGEHKPKAVADRLSEMGIKGIKYFDAGSRGDAEEKPTRNYVVFDDKLVGVRRRYEQGGAVDAEHMATGGEVGDDVPYHQTPEFQNWFGDSVAHMDGVPVTYYHGTSKDKDFPSFNVGRHGTWLTSNPEEASQYAEQNDSQDYKYEGGKYIKTNTASRVIPVHLKAENPYLGEKPEELFQQQNYKKAQSDWFDGLRDQGYDSWIPASQNGALAVILKEPTQIKSIYNRKFDPKNKRMDKAVGGEAENPDIPQIDNAMSIFPKPQRMFPQDAPVAGGQYLNAATKEDMTGHKAAMASIGVQPGGKPYFRASPDSVDETGTPGRGSAITKTNLFKQKAGWKWAQAPEGHEATDTIVSVAHRGQHHYTLNAHFPKGVDLARYENSPTEPRLRPTTKGNVTLGPQVGSILVRGKEHPVYEHVIVKNMGGEVSGKKASGGHVATLRRMSDPAVNEAIRVINRSGSSPRDAVTLSKRLLGRQ